MIKEKDMFDFRDNVRYQDGADVTIQTAQIALSNCAREHGVPVIFTINEQNEKRFVKTYKIDRRKKTGKTSDQIRSILLLTIQQIT